MLSHPHICQLSNYYPPSVTFICQEEAARRHRLFEPGEIRFEFRSGFGLHIYGNIRLIKRGSCDARSFKSRGVWNACVRMCVLPYEGVNWMLTYFHTTFYSILQVTAYSMPQRLWLIISLQLIFYELKSEEMISVTRDYFWGRFPKENLTWQTS